LSGDADVSPVVGFDVFNSNAAPEKSKHNRKVPAAAMRERDIPARAWMREEHEADGSVVGRT
jgi:hypothetical protein